MFQTTFNVHLTCHFFPNNPLKTINAERRNSLATQFRALHKSGEPVVLCNVYDAATAGLIAANPAAKAIATTSYACAAVQGTDDDNMKIEQHLAAVKTIAPVALQNGLPLTVDARDGYGDQLEHLVTSLIELGAVGCNLEDLDSTSGQILPTEHASRRVAQAIDAAARVGVPQFAVNARTDILRVGGTIADAIERGKAYLAAGATSVFVFVLDRELSREEIKALVKAFDGKLNVTLTLGPGCLTIPELKELGVARISVGPELFRVAMKAYDDAATKLLQAALEPSSSQK